MSNSFNFPHNSLGACLCWTDFLAKALKKEFFSVPRGLFLKVWGWCTTRGLNWVFMAEGKESFNVPLWVVWRPYPVSWLSLELREVTMKAALGAVHGLFGVLCADFCVRIFVCGFLVRIFGADFSVRIFRCGFLVRIFRCGFFGADFGADFWCGFLCGFFGGFFFARRPQGERQKKSSKKSIKKSSPKSSPKFPLQKSSPKSSPNPSQDIRSGPHLDSKEMWVHTVMPLWRLAPKVVAFWQQVAVVDTG